MRLVRRKCTKGWKESNQFGGVHRRGLWVWAWAWTWASAWFGLGLGFGLTAGTICDLYHLEEVFAWYVYARVQNPVTENFE